MLSGQRAYSVLRNMRRKDWIKSMNVFIIGAMLLVPFQVIGAALEPPVAEALPEYQEVNVGDYAYFNGTLSYDPDGTIENYSWDFGDFNYGYGMIVNHSYVTAGNYTVTLTVWDNDGLSDNDTCIVNVTGNGSYPVIIVEKVVDLAVAYPGDYLTYTIYFDNTGNGTADFVWINDTLPTGVIYISDTANLVVGATFVGPTGVSGQYLFFNFTDVQPGPHSFTITVYINPSVPPGTLLSNSVTCNYTPSGQQTEDWAITTVVRPVIVVEKAVDKTKASVGEILAYTIWFNNTGSGIADYVWINDTLPVGVTYISDTAATSPTSAPYYVSSGISGQQLWFNFTNVPPGVHNFEITVQIDNGVANGTLLINWVFCNYTAPNGLPFPGTDDNATTLVGGVNEGTLSGYVTDPSMNPIEGALVRVYFHGSYEENYTDSSGYYHVVNILICNCTKNVTASKEGYTTEWVWLSIGYNTTYDFILTPLALDLYIYPEDISFSNPNPSQWEEITISAEIHSNDWVEETEEPPVQVIKTVDKSYASPGDLLVYTIYCNNTGPDWVDSVNITDELHWGVIFVNSVPMPSMFNGNNVTWYISNLAPGSSFIMEMIVQIDMGVSNGTVIENYVVCNYSPNGTQTEGWAYTTIGSPQDTFDIPVHAGWNFISVPLVQENTSILAVFNDDGGNTTWDVAQWFDASYMNRSWKTYATFKPAPLNTLTDIDHTMGILIYITDVGSDHVLRVRGSLPPPNTTVPLWEGWWNMVGYPAIDDSTQTVGDVKRLTGNIVTDIAHYDDQYYSIVPYDDSYVMKRGEGYWFNVTGINQTHPYNWTIENDPTPVANSTCTVSFYLDNMSAENIIYREYEVFVPNDSSTVVSHAWLADVPGNHTIIVDITDSNPAETVLSNNTAFKNIYISEPYGKLKVKASSDKQKYIKGVDDQAEIIVKVTYHGQLIEGATVWAWVIDPNTVNISVAMSEASPGIYTGIYDFTNVSKSGTYRIKAVASKPGFINGENNYPKDTFFLKHPGINVPEVSSVGLSSHLPVQGSDVIVTVPVTYPENVNSIYSKFIGHSGRATFVLPLFDDGTHWDLTPGDGVFTSSFSTEDMSDTFSADIIINNVLSENRAVLVVNSSDIIALETFNGLQTAGNSLLFSSLLTNTTLNITTITEISDICFSIVEHRTVNDGKRIEIIPSRNVNVAMIEAYIELAYTNQDVPTGSNESDMRLYLYNIYTGELESCLPGGVRPLDDIVWGETEHFSDFKFIVDTISPVHKIENPISGGYSRSITPTISVEVTDESGIESSTIRLYVNGYSVFYELVDIEYGYRVSYTHGAGFAEGEIISCRIVAEDMLVNVLDWTWSFTVLHSFDISLNQGWNLVSLPYAQVDTSILEALSSIDGKWDYARYYDAITDNWKSYAIFKPACLNDFWNVDHHIAFWLHTTEPCTLTAYGLSLASANIPLYAGWNLVGYPTLNDTETVGVAFFGTGADKVMVCDLAEPYRIKEVGPGYVMKPGEGYWVHVVADSVWIVNW